MSQVEDSEKGAEVVVSDDALGKTVLVESADKKDDTPDPRRWLFFGIVAAAVMMGSLDQTVVATALPTIHHELHSPVNWTAWTITIYQLGLIIGLPVAGRLSDQFGRKKLFLICVSIFTLSSLACGTAHNIEWLIGFRAIQAIGTAGLMPSAAGIVADHFGRDRDRGIGFFLSVVPIGSFVGPLLGGTIINFWSWRGVFLINIPIAVVVLILAIKFIPHSSGKAGAKADFLGIGLLAATILPFILGITEIGDGKTALYSPKVLGPIALSILVGVFLVKHMNEIEEPIIPVRLLRGKAFGAMNLVNVLYGACVLGMGALIPLYAEFRYNFNPVEAGSVVSARAIGVLAFSGIATVMLRRTGYRRPMLYGFGLAAVAIFLQGFGPHGIAPYAWLTVCGALLGIGSGVAIPAVNNAVLNLAPGNIASISGLRGMFKQVGAMLAISIGTALAARSPHPGHRLGEVFIAFAVIMAFCVLPLIVSVPEHKGSW